MKGGKSWNCWIWYLIWIVYYKKSAVSHMFRNASWGNECGTDTASQLRPLFSFALDTICVWWKTPSLELGWGCWLVAKTLCSVCNVYFNWWFHHNYCNSQVWKHHWCDWVRYPLWVSSSNTNYLSQDSYKVDWDSWSSDSAAHLLELFLAACVITLWKKCQLPCWSRKRESLGLVWQKGLCHLKRSKVM